MLDRRRSKRLPMRGFLDCRLEFSMSGKMVDLPVLSLSATGLYLAVDEEHGLNLAFDTKLEDMRFDLQDLSNLKLTGHVVHRMSFGKIGGCGVEFKDCSDADVSFLDNWVDRKLKEFGLQ